MINHVRMKLLKHTIPFLLCGVLLSGCWDRTEINDVAFVLGTTVDREKDGYRVGMLIALPGNMGGPLAGGAQGKKPYMIQTEVGATLREVLEKLQLQLSRRLFFAHRRVLLLGEDVMKEEDILPLMDNVLRNAESRLTTFIAVTHGRAIDLLGADVKLERFPVEAVRELLQSDASIRFSLKDAILNMHRTGSEATFPYLELVKTKIANTESEEIRVTGYVLTKTGKQVGLLQERDANVIRFLQEQFTPFTQKIHTDTGVTSVLVSHAKKAIKPYLRGDDIHFDINVYVEGNINEDLSKKNTFSHIPEVEKLMSEQLKVDINQVLETLKNKKSDIGFGQILNRQYPNKWKEQWEPNWDDKFTECHFHVAVTTRIYRVGMLRENLSIREE